MIVRRITANKELWVHTMMREELGILEETVNPATIGLLMMAAFTMGGIPPLLPYMFMQQPLAALKMAVVVSLFALFLVGVVKTALTHQPWLKSGLEVVLLGSIAAGIGFGIGKAISWLWPELGAVGL